MVFSISNVCIQASINSFGSIAVAGSAAALNFEYFTYFLLNSFSQAAVTFVSQNFGAKQYKRCDRIIKLCVVMGAISTTLLSSVFMLFGDSCLSIYTSDEVVKQYGLIRMKHILMFQFINSVMDVTSGGIRGMGYSTLPAVVAIAGVCGFRLLWVYTIFERYPTIEMLFNVYPISWVLTCIGIIIAYEFVKRKHIINGEYETVVS